MIGKYIRSAAHSLILPTVAWAAVAWAASSTATAATQATQATQAKIATQAKTAPQIIEQAKLVPLSIKTSKALHEFRVEIAQSQEEQSRGLMFRLSLPVDGGMLFPFPQPKIASFWMKNTLIPLDILFIRSNGSIDRIVQNTIPHSLQPVTSLGKVAAVLELLGGTSARLGIDETAVITWKNCSQP